MLYFRQKIIAQILYFECLIDTKKLKDAKREDDAFISVVEKFSFS